MHGSHVLYGDPSSVAEVAHSWVLAPLVVVPVQTASSALFLENLPRNLTERPGPQPSLEKGGTEGAPVAETPYPACLWIWTVELVGL